MDEKVLRAIGISGGVVIAIGLAGLAIYAYKTYLEVQHTKLEIKKLKLQLLNPEGIKQGNF